MSHSPSLCLLGSLLHVLARCTCSASEFHLDGDFSIGGLFDVHNSNELVPHEWPEAINCSSQDFIIPSYQRLQFMRFAIEEINNSTSLLPNVSLGYELFDICSETHNFPGILKLISFDGMIQPWGGAFQNLSRVMAVVGPFSSTDSLTTAPLFMSDLIPMITYGAAASVLSEKLKYPSFLRTVHSNKDVIEAIVKIILHFHWRWVAFFNSDNDFGKDGLEMFRKRIMDTDICLAYAKGISLNTDFPPTFKQIKLQKIRVIIVFTTKTTAEALVMSAIQQNVTDKVWIAGDTWSLNKMLPKEEGIKKIGTVIGVSQPVVTVPGFKDFIYSTKKQNHCEVSDQTMVCSQVCNCSGLSAQDILREDPSYTFPVYTAVYAIAHALHNALKCGVDKCPENIPISPHLVLAEIKKSNFTLLNHSIQFDENGDPKFGDYSIIYWNSSGDAEEIGYYHFYPRINYFINDSKIQWYTKGEVPSSLCSPECPEGYAKKLLEDGIHKCCFTCKICRNGTYLNETEDPYTCVPCKETEWSTAGSTSCRLRLVEYIPFSDAGAVLIMAGACAFVVLTLSMSVLFAVNYHTPVVRSAGGPMCFLILGCLSLCSLSVFFHFDKPTQAFCILGFLPFLLFYTVCLACFVVRSFQIVCIFKIAAKIPELQRWWMKYHGQWLVIMVAFGIQALIIVISYSDGPPQPYNETVWYPDQIILSCNIDIKASISSFMVLASLCCLCFIFSYMGKDLPKNYNEAKAITFCLLLLILTWILFATVYMLYRGKYIQIMNGLAILSSLYSFLLWYFLPKCYIIIFQPQKNTQQYFQGLIQNYTMTMSQ